MAEEREPGSVGENARRRQRILELLDGEGQVRTAELSRRLGVSEISVRKDLDFLEGRGLLRRVHGGARPVGGTAQLLDLAERYLLHRREKAAIAREAAALVRPGMTLYVDTGTTTLLLVRSLPRDLPLTVVTNSLSTIAALNGASACTVITLGGIVDYRREVVTGLWADEQLDRFSFDIAFTGASSVTPRGFGCDDLPLGDILRGAVARAARAYVLADVSKVGRQTAGFYARPGEVTAWITDPGLDPAFARDFPGRVVLAGGGAA